MGTIMGFTTGITCGHYVHVRSAARENEYHGLNKKTESCVLHSPSLLLLYGVGVRVGVRVGVPPFGVGVSDLMAAGVDVLVVGLRVFVGVTIVLR